jgi:hypothetical protein
MATFANRIIDSAEADVGEHEVPWGSNDGPFVFGEVQLPYDPVPPPFYRGLAWCGMAVGKWTRDAGADDWKTVCSPSTALMAQYARDHGLVGAARPGAYIIWPGKHVELIVALAGLGVVNTIGGNTSDMVAHRVRSTAGTVIMWHPLLKGEKTETEDAVRFWFHDPQAKVLKSQWFKTKAARTKWLNRISADWRERATLISSPRDGYRVHIGPRKDYGPFRTREARNKAMRRVQAVMHYNDRVLVPYKTGTEGGKKAPSIPDQLGKTQ